MIAVSSKEVVRGAEKFVRGVAKCGIDLFLASEREPVEYLAAKGASGRLRLGLGPVDAGDAALVVAAVGVLAAVDDDAGMQQRRPDGPEDRGYPAGLCVCGISEPNRATSRSAGVTLTGSRS